MSTFYFKYRYNLNSLWKEIQGILIDFIFNLDEMGSSEYEDSRQQTVIAPISYQYQPKSMPHA